MNIIPQPKKMEEGKGDYSLPYTGVITLDVSMDAQGTAYATLLKESISQELGFSYTLSKGNDRTEIMLRISKELEKEHYQLVIHEKGICITGAHSQEILYGIQTLRQIIRQKGANLPFLKIEDHSSISNRGYYHDVTRGRVPTLKWLKELADILSFYKINQLQLYVEHSFLFSGLSEMWRDDTPLTAEEIMELDSYCISRGVELIPSLSSFGHLYKLLRTREYCHLCEREGMENEPFGFMDRMQHHTLDVSQEASFELVKNLILKYMDLFTSKKFNICADETFDLGKGRNRKRMEEEGIEALYMGFVKKLCSLIAENGHIPMMWGDIMLDFPHLAKELPQETICLNWNYDEDVKEDAAKIYWENKVKQYVCPGVSGWSRLINDYRKSYHNIKKMCCYGSRYETLGVLNTDWGDYGHINHPAHSIPGLIYGAEGSWNGDLPDFEEMNRKISVLQFRDSAGQVMNEISILGDVSKDFGWSEAVRFKEKLVCGEGDKEENARILEQYRGRIKNIVQRKNELTESIHALKKNMEFMENAGRKQLYSYFLAAEGILIFDTIGELIFGKESADKETRYETAGKLEKWYYDYRCLWKQYSKESELYRIGEVIFWYADYLRGDGQETGRS